jgi:hypothetical protein
MEACLKIYHYYVLNDDVTPVKKLPTLESFLQKYKAIRDLQLPYHVFVEEATNKIIGFNFYFPAKRFVIPCQLPHCLDNSMYLLPEYKNLRLQKRHDDIMIEKYKKFILDQGYTYLFGMSVNPIYTEGKSNPKRKIVEGVVGLVLPGIWFSRGRFMNPVMGLSDFRIPSPRI